ncbi:probable glycosyltransferase 2 [Dendrobium catenatum]|uniref:Glycosyltransferase 3 n=1 Tax=Dendrobium catenatum TaxID=906689 RepID=A0A2I0VWB1_9ASPA|nr:probable glycosyltransferase 2 [Dendrobium catenatum]PKU67687.1 Putative glycosyltransferase 3 [Dendrobium catenatum]
MRQEAKRLGLPSTRSSHGSRRRKIQKTFNNVKITILCGLVTIVVLRGTIGLGNLAAVVDGESNQKEVEDIERILREIRSDSDPDEDGIPQFSEAVVAAGNITTADNVTLSGSDAASYVFGKSYTLGPKIANWDQQREQWQIQNPGFPSQIADGKPKILLVTGSPPNPCDNPIGDHYLLKATKNKIDYCRLHGIEIVYNMAHLDRELAGYWAKLPLLRRLMLSHPEVEWIWWMDSDALFTDMDFEIPMSKYTGYNLVIHGYPDLLFEQHSWIALNTGSFLFRNCQWSLDLLDAWAPMGPKGPVRDEAGRLLTANLKGRPAFEADDQSALIYLLLAQQDKWGNKVYVENSYYLHGFWAGLVDKYEEMMEKHHPGLGDERWPFVTHFVGCKPCGSYGDYPVERCISSMERAFNFADNQVLRIYGFAHRRLSSSKIRRIRNETVTPLDIKKRINVQDRIISS